MPLSNLKSQQRWLLFPLIVSFILFAVVYIANLNTPLFHWFNKIPDATSPILWKLITNFGNGLWISVLLLLFTWKKPTILFRWLLIAITVTVFIKIAKPFFNNPRPYDIFNLDLMNLLGDELTSKSFPSAHATTIFAFAGLIIFRFRSALLKYAILLFALLVGVSRICIGAHWPLDVIAGAFAGWSCAIVGSFVAGIIKLELNYYLQWILASILLAVCIFLIFFYNPGFGNSVLWVQRFIALAGLGLSYFTFRKIIYFRRAHGARDRHSSR